MTLSFYIKHYLATLVAFFLIDMVWLGLVARGFYRMHLAFLLSYATYDLTNLATIKDWPVIITVVDMIWGTVLAASVAQVSFLAGRWLL